MKYLKKLLVCDIKSNLLFYTIALYLTLASCSAFAGPYELAMCDDGNCGGGPPTGIEIFFGWLLILGGVLYWFVNAGTKKSTRIWYTVFIGSFGIWAINLHKLIPQIFGWLLLISVGLVWYWANDTEEIANQETERPQGENQKNNGGAGTAATSSNGQGYKKYTLEKQLSTLSVIAVLVAAVIAGEVGKTIGKAVMTPAIPGPEQIEEKLIEGFTAAARQYKTKLPMMIDNDTRLDSVTVGPGPRIHYHYAFPNYTSKDIGSYWLRENLLPEVKSKLCASKETRPALELGGIYVFSYAASDGQGIDKFEFDRNDCGIANKYPLKETTTTSPYQSNRETDRDIYRQIPEATTPKENGQTAAREAVVPNMQWDNDRYGVTTESQNNNSAQQEQERLEREKSDLYERLEKAADQEKAARMEMTAKLEKERLGKEKLEKENLKKETPEEEKERLEKERKWLEREQESYRSRSF